MGASAMEENLGWRVASPDDSTVDSAIQAGLLPGHDSGSRPMHVMLPLDEYPNLNTGVSGPLWTGRIGDPDVMASMSEAAAEGICKVDDPEMGPKEVRRAKQAVRRICDEGKAIHGSHLVITDALPSFVGRGSAEPSKMAEALRVRGVSVQRFRGMQSLPSEQMHPGQPYYRLSRVFLEWLIRLCMTSQFYSRRLPARILSLNSGLLGLSKLSQWL